MAEAVNDYNAVKNDVQPGAADARSIPLLSDMRAIMEETQAFETAYLSV